VKEPRYSYAQLGMLLGLFAGSGLAVILFSITGNAVYFVVVGIGLSLGLSLGVAFDQKRARLRKGHESSDTRNG
jgi:hypothetical protein